MRRLPDPSIPPGAGPESRERPGSAIPSPAFAFLLTLIALPSLFWLVTLKRTTGHTVPEGRMRAYEIPATEGESELSSLQIASASGYGIG